MFRSRTQFAALLASAICGHALAQPTPSSGQDLVERYAFHRRGSSHVAPSALPAAAPDALFNALEGHSIVADLHESLMTGRGETFENRWRDRVYISTKGRIFHRFDSKSTRPGVGGVREFVGEADGSGEGRGAKYVWTSNGLSRQWVNRRGTTLRQSIFISRSGDGFSCSMRIERLAGGQPRTIDARQSCRVFRGNVLAGQG
jgi:hypothetical protein